MKSVTRVVAVRSDGTLYPVAQPRWLAFLASQYALQPTRAGQLHAILGEFCINNIDTHRGGTDLDSDLCTGLFVTSLSVDNHGFICDPVERSEQLELPSSTTVIDAQQRFQRRRWQRRYGWWPAPLQYQNAMELLVHQVSAE